MRRPCSSACSPRSRSRWSNWDYRCPESRPLSMWSAECNCCVVNFTARMAMTTSSDGELPLNNEHDIVLGRQAVRRMTQQQGFSLVDQTKMVTAASELARNALIYGGGGKLKWAILQNGGKRGLRLTFEDQGPGIADIDLALTDGWTSGKGLGLGLTGARRLVNEFELDSKPGAGTRVTVTRWK